MRILIVDDDTELREELAEVLVDAGFSVQTAANGLSALRAMLAGDRPDLILLDIQMPVMDGWHFLSARLAHPEIVVIPVILMSALPENQERAVGVVSELVAKEAGTEALLAAIDRCRRMFPVLDEHAEKLRAEAAQARRLLVVEDDDDARETLADLLRTEGYEVEEARDGRGALASLRQQLDEERIPTAIITDLRMPGMDGWSFWRALRQDTVLSGIPLILVSGNPYELDKVDESVVSLSKPVDFARLMAAIRKLVPSPPR
jgi:CheY-like chemotaxis protein